MPIKISSANVRYTEDTIEADYLYETTDVKKEGNEIKVTPRSTPIVFRTKRVVPKLGLMLVGWGGNNGSTVTATIIANRCKISWNTKEGVKHPNYLGSITQASTVLLGTSAQGEEIYVPMNDLLPMVNPNEILLDGWDISGLDLGSSMERACVLDFDLQRQLRPLMSSLRPRASIYDKSFIAANQEERADNVIQEKDKWGQVEQVRRDIRDFKHKSGLDKIIVLWTANTERFCTESVGLHDTADNLVNAIKKNESEISPSTLFAVASILEGCPYINGSPQNTFVPGVIEMASAKGIPIAGDDFKSGQTKFKSVIVDFLVNAGIKPVSIVSYNHLGNNDGKNLSAPAQFRSKEISKSNVVDDMVKSNGILYDQDEKPDHCVVIKYVPYVGDSKRALDEYTSEIMMGGHNTIAVHNTCEDSLLAAPLILDLAILAELFQRVTFKVDTPLAKTSGGLFQTFHSVQSLLSYLCKAPLVPKGANVVNALFRQRAAIENVLRACIGLSPLNHMSLEQKMSDERAWREEAKARGQERKRIRNILGNGSIKG